MPPKLTADAFESQYGKLVTREYSQCGTARVLNNALKARKPPILVSDAMLKVWFGKYRLPPGGVKVSSAQELNERFGEEVVELEKKNGTAYLLSKALKARNPPVLAPDGVCRQWLLRYRGELQTINTGGELEMLCGARIRREAVFYHIVWFKA